jgi:hypothetical protein
MENGNGNEISVKELSSLLDKMKKRLAVDRPLQLVPLIPELLCHLKQK